MKKGKNNKKEKKVKYAYNKWIYLFAFVFCMTCVLLKTKSLDNDIWYILSEGREIVQNGIYKIDPLSIHDGLKVTVQNWLSASIFWIIYDLFKEAGLLIFMLICNFFICLLIYKISMLISENNRILSLTTMVFTDLILSLNFIVSRPQIISFIVLLSLIYVLELYIKTENKKYLIWIPILSLLEVNLHASLWWMLFLFMLPYVIDSFKCPLLKLQGYKKKPLFIAIGIALLMGLVNPYGYKAISFIFTSYGDKYMHLFILELLPFSFNSALSKQSFVLMLTLGLIYTFFRSGNIRVRYICLFCGTLILGFISVKGFSHFELVSIFPLAYFFKDMVPKDLSILDDFIKKSFKYTACAMALVICVFYVAMFYQVANKVVLKSDIKSAMTVIKNTIDPEDTIIYSSFKNGGNVEFEGYKAYIDPRAEVFLKINNGKKDIFKEFYDLQHGNLDVSEFLEEYNFTHLIVENGDYLYNNMEGQENYEIYYEQGASLRLYIRKDIKEKLNI